MIKEALARTVKALTGACEHEVDKQAKVEYLACATCGTELKPIPGQHDSSEISLYCPHDPKHNDEKSGSVLLYVKCSRVVCLNCGNEVEPPTTHFRNYMRLNKHIKQRRGTPTDKHGRKLSETPTFNVGLRYVVPDHFQAIKRVWVTFDEKPASKRFAEMIDREMRFCKNDVEYNAVINRNIDIVKAANPGITEEVVENDGDGEDK